MADNADQHEFIPRLGDVKDAIGEWHDWQELTAIAGDILDRGPRCQLLRELQRISEVKYQRALADALRKKYLRGPRQETGRTRGPRHQTRLAGQGRASRVKHHTKRCVRFCLSRPHVSRGCPVPVAICATGRGFESGPINDGKSGGYPISGVLGTKGGSPALSSELSCAREPGHPATLIEEHFPRNRRTLKQREAQYVLQRLRQGHG
jgi:hypothetical protein